MDVAAGSTQIISDGVVTAPGYDPIVITQTESNKNSNKPSDIFNPDVDIITETETEYEERIRQEQIYANNTNYNKKPQVVYIDRDDKTSTVIVTVAIMILLFVMVISGVKYYQYQQNKDLIDVQNIHEKHAQYDRKASMGSQTDKNAPNHMNLDSE